MLASSSLDTPVATAAPVSPALNQLELNSDTHPQVLASDGQTWYSLDL